jgi:hypothetical protein
MPDFENLIFDFEGDQVIKLIDLADNLTPLDYRRLLSTLAGKTLTVDKDGNTLIFWSDVRNFLKEL